MGSLIASAGDIVPITLFLDDEDTTKFPRAKVFDSAGNPTPLAIVDLLHVAEGLYRGTWTIPSRDKFFLKFNVFVDSARTIKDLLHRPVAQCLIADLKDPPTVSLSVAYDDSIGELRMHAWLFRDGAAVLDGTSASVTIFNQDGTTLLTSTAGVPERQPSGAFLLVETGIALLDNNSYTATVTVTDPLGTVSKTRGLPTLS